MCYGSMIERITLERIFHGILKKAQVELSFGSTENPWGLSHGFY